MGACPVEKESLKFLFVLFTGFVNCLTRPDASGNLTSGKVITSVSRTGLLCAYVGYCVFFDLRRKLKVT